MEDRNHQAGEKWDRINRRETRAEKETEIRLTRWGEGWLEQAREATHLGQFTDEVMSVRFLRGFDHLLLGNAVISVPDILPYRCVKEHRLLADHAYVRA